MVYYNSKSSSGGSPKPYSRILETYLELPYKTPALDLKEISRYIFHQYTTNIHYLLSRDEKE
jgi:hypothetical protein